MTDIKSIQQKLNWLLSVLNKKETDEFKNFTQADKEFAKALLATVDINTVKKSKIISYYDKNFVLSLDDFNDLSPAQYANLKKIAAMDTTLHNPIYVSIEEDDTLIID